jgi:hypothetical protein
LSRLLEKHRLVLCPRVQLVVGGGGGHGSRGEARVGLAAGRGISIGIMRGKEGEAVAHSHVFIQE